MSYHPHGCTSTKQTADIDTVSDAVVLIRDMAADSAQKAANVVRPPEEMLSKIDEPAEQNTWHEKPNLSKDDLKQRLSKKKTVSLHWSILLVTLFFLTNKLSGHGDYSRRNRVSTSRPG